MTQLVPVDAANDAAVMVMLLEDDQAAVILSQLEPEELRLLRVPDDGEEIAPDAAAGGFHEP